MHHFGLGDNHRENRDGCNILQGLERNLVNGILDDRICNSQSWNAQPPCNQQYEFQFPNIYPPCDGPPHYQPQQVPQSFDGNNYYRDPSSDNRPVGSNSSEYPYPPQMGPRTFTDNRGGEFTVDQGRMTQMRDDAGRNFEFGYDHCTHQLNHVRNESGEWDRGAGGNSNVWTKRGTNETWTGNVSAGFVTDQYGRQQPSYSFDDGRVKRTYNMDGTVTELNHETNHSLRFGYDRDGNCGTIQDGSTLWKHSQGDEWDRNHMVNGQPQRDRLFGQMNVDLNQGSYTWNNGDGNSTTYNSDSSNSHTFQGNRIDTDPQGKVTGFDPDGREFPCDPINGAIKYDVRHGVTVHGHLNLHGAQLDSNGDMNMPANAPINAFESGHCVYSSGDKNHYNYSLLPEDVDVIKNLEDPGKNVVVVQTKDGRYDIYSGLGRADSQIGQWLERNSIIGQAGDDGQVNFSVRRQRVSGNVVNLSGD